MNDETLNRDLFDSRLSDSAKRYIRKFKQLAGMVFLINILLGIVYISNGIIMYTRFQPQLFEDYPLVVIQYQITPFYSILYFAFFVMQGYYYRKTAHYFSNGVTYSNEKIINQAFFYLHRNGVLAVITLILGLIINVFDLIVSLSYNSR